MAVKTKKELVVELVALGFEEAKIKDMKNVELEAMLAEKEEQAKLPDTQEDTQEDEGNEDTSNESADSTDLNDPATGEDNGESQPETDVEGASDVLRETSQQLGIFSDYIYNVKNKGATVVVDNLGYGDVYFDTEDLAKHGKSARLLFQETATIEGAERIYFVSGSQPVIQIIEIK